MKNNKELIRLLAIIKASILGYYNFAKKNEFFLLAIVLTGTKRKKRNYSLNIYADAIFLLNLLYGSKKKTAERISFKSVSSLTPWTVCMDDNPIDVLTEKIKELKE